MNVDARIEGLIAERVDAAGREGLAALRGSLAESGVAWLEVYFASLPRRLGRAVAPGGVVEVLDGKLVVAAWRACDLAAADLLRRALAADADPAVVERLYRQGDAEERRMVLRSLPWLPSIPGREELLLEAHRTNDQVLFEAGLLDSDLPARLLDPDAWNNVVLKVAFADLSLDRILGWESRANRDLSRMLLDFMSEREAAGRPTWGPSLELAAVAPTDGVVERVVGDLWHGSDRRRLAAARAAARLGGPQMQVAIRARLGFERSAAVAATLEAAGAIDPSRNEG